MFRKIAQQFPKCLPLIPYLEPHSNLDLEGELERLESDADPESHPAACSFGTTYWRQVSASVGLLVMR